MAGVNGPGGRAPDWLALRARRSPEALSLRYRNRSHSFAAVDRMVTALCREMRQAVDAAARPETAILNGNPFLTLLAVHACARLNWPLTVLDPRRSARWLLAQCARLDIEVLFTPDADAPWRSEAERVQSDTAVVALASPRPSDTAMAPTHESAASDPPVRLGQRQGWILTSGSTGEPKAIPLTFRNLYWSACASALRLGFGLDDRWLHCLPLHHVGGLALLFRSVLFGFGLDLQDRFQAETTVDLIRSNQVTMASFVPTMLVRLLDAGLTCHDDTVRFRWALMGGSKVSLTLREDCQRQGIPILPSYGLTESCSHIAACGPDAGTCQGEGRPLKYTHVRIRDREGGEVPHGVPGAIWLRGPQICPTTGWFYTGDIGAVDERGNLHVLERQDDMILTGGENVYASEVIRALERHPAVTSAWVQGLPDREWGSKIVAMVETRGGTDIAEETLRRHCRLQLAAYQIPKHILITPAIPRTETGKVQRVRAHQLLMAAFA